jgi:hypothetical protein
MNTLTRAVELFGIIVDSKVCGGENSTGVQQHLVRGRGISIIAASTVRGGWKDIRSGFSQILSDLFITYARGSAM